MGKDWKPSHKNLELERDVHKEIQIENEECNLSLFTDDMILYIGEPKDSIKRLLGSLGASHKRSNKSRNLEAFL